jgi:TonB-linked SusC/RagA family outer membrane protein
MKPKILLNHLGLSFFALLLFCTSLVAQEIVLTGKVSENNGTAIPGVTILVKGTSKGTTTDGNGAYKLSIPNDKATLIFSYIGFASQEFIVGNRTSLDVTLLDESLKLNEIVVTALGIKKELRNLGYSTQDVKGSDLIKAREPNTINSLVGKVAGLSVGPSSELLGRPQLVLRGKSELLFVVDGVPVNSDTWNLSADDIETYTILKGANAAALYGFRGQNGAVLITTKRGTKDKRGYSVEFNSSTMADASFLTLPTNQAEYGPGSNYNYRFGDGPYDDAGTGGTDRRPNVWGPRFEGQAIRQYNSPIGADGKRIGTPFIAKGVDNYAKFMETGILSNNNISIGSSNENSDIRISLSNSYQKGIAPNTGLNIANFNISAGQNFSKKLRLEGNLNFNRQNTPNIPDVSYGPNSYTYLFKVYGPQHYDIDEMRDYYQSPGKEGVQQYFFEYGRNNNPYFIANEWLRGHYKTDVFGQAKLSYKFTDYLDIALRSQVTTWNSLRDEKLPYSMIIYGRDFRQGDYREDRRSMFENNTDLLMKFDKKVIPDLNISAIIGANARTFQYSSSWESTDYLIVPGVYNLSNSKNPKLAYNFKSDMSVFSVYGSFDATYKNYLTLSATGRDDKSSTLKNSFFYPSVSLSTVLTDYINFPSVLSFAKLRGSYANVKGGLTRSNIGPAWQASGQANPLQYGTDYSTSYDGPSYDNQNSYNTKLLYNNTPSTDYSSQLANEGLKPFTVTSYEAGLDMKFLKNRLGLELTYFRTEDGPRILGVPVASSTAYRSRLVNDLTTERKGWEVALSGTPIKNAEGFTWEILTNWSTFKERIKKIEDPAGYINGAFGDHKYLVGERVDGVYDYKLYYNTEGQLIHTGGLPLFNPGGTDAKKLLGYYNPDWVGSINNRFSFKNFNVSFQFDGRFGGIIYDEIRGDQYQSGTSYESVTGAYGVARNAEWESFKNTGTIKPSYVGPGVTIASGSPKFDAKGNISNIGELTFAPNTTNVRVQNYMQFLQGKEPLYVSRSFAKLREIVIGYKFPNSLFEKSIIKQASVSFVGRNLLYFAKSKAFDLDQFAGSTVGPPLQTATTRRIGMNINLVF